MKREKIAPGLTRVRDAYNERGPSAITNMSRTLSLVSFNNPNVPPHAEVFLHCDEGSKFDHLATERVRVDQKEGPVRTAFLPLEALDPLSEDSHVHYIVPSRYLRLLMDVAPGACFVSDFRSANPTLTGKGVLIGVIDTGIDAAHPAFAGRIKRVWDQTIHGPGVAEGQYGLEFTGQLLSASEDTNGHGTHVAGIAAGSAGAYQGIAPGADLLVIRSSLSSTQVSNGIEYIFRVADELGMPAVINLSLGNHTNAHDGTDELSHFIDKHSGPGHIVCCASGNEGNDDIHAQTTVNDGSTESVRFWIPAANPSLEPMIVGINGWYSGSQQLELAIQSPKGFITPFQSIMQGGSIDHSYTLPEGEVVIYTPGPDPRNGDHNFLVEITNPTNPELPPVSGTWKLLLKGTAVSAGGAQVDLWILDSIEGFNAIFTSAVDSSMKIGAPGCAASAITVGSYTTKVNWTDLTAGPQTVSYALHGASDFSSGGPLRNGGKKPDLVAPGAMIVAPRSKRAVTLSPYIIDAEYRVNAGTSMSTPFVSGLVALLLQADPTLDPNGVKARLQASCSIPNQPPGSFDLIWGFGLPDARRL